MTPTEMRNKAAEYHAQAKALSPQYRAALKIRTTKEGAKLEKEIGDKMSEFDRLGFDLERQADYLEMSGLINSLVAVIKPLSSISQRNKIQAIQHLLNGVRKNEY